MRLSPLLATSLMLNRHFIKIASATIPARNFVLL